jgi:uncharacterized DUF497 family protein
MRFDWDEGKNRINKVKHGVSFETAIHVFEDPYHKTVLSGIENGEYRWRTFGHVAVVVLLMVAHTFIEAPEEVVRIVSARKATRKERALYEEVI